MSGRLHRLGECPVEIVEHRLHDELVNPFAAKLADLGEKMGELSKGGVIER